MFMAPFMFYYSTSSNYILVTLNVLLLFVLGLAYGFISSVIFSGLKGDGHSVDSTYIMGFGAHHPGGIILSDDHPNMQDRKVQRQVFISH